MNQNSQAFAVEHEPGDDCPELRWPEDRLIHGLRMGSYWLVVPTPKLYLEIFRKTGTHSFGGFASVGIVIYMRVIVPYISLVYRHNGSKILFNYYQMKRLEPNRDDSRADVAGNEFHPHTIVEWY